MASLRCSGPIKYHNHTVKMWLAGKRRPSFASLFKISLIQGDDSQRKQSENERDLPSSQRTVIIIRLGNVSEGVSYTPKKVER
jgi:hypothetical protein